MLSNIYAGLGSAALSGLFGGSGQAPNVPYTNQITGDIGSEEVGGQNNYGTAGNLSSLGNQQTGAFNAFAPTATNQTNSYLNLLNQNPYTDSYSAGQLANATSGLNTAYGQGVSQLQQSLGSRGLGGDGSSGGMNSTMAGGLTALGAGKAQTLGQTANQIAMNAIQQRYQNLGTAQGVASNYANQLYGQGVGADQAAVAANQSAAGIFGNAAQQYLGLGGLQQGANQQYQQQLGGVGSLLGYGLGSVFGGGRSPQSGGASPFGGGSSAYNIPQISPQTNIGGDSALGYNFFGT